MNEILKQFTNEELLDRYGEFYRKTQNNKNSSKNHEMMMLLKIEILKRMENENEKH